MLLYCRPGLLGKAKYDFAKTYCDVKTVQGYQGQLFQVVFRKHYMGFTDAYAWMHCI